MDTTNPNTQEQGVCPRCGGALRERHYMPLNGQPLCGDCIQQIREKKHAPYSSKKYQDILAKVTK